MMRFFPIAATVLQMMLWIGASAPLVAAGIPDTLFRAENPSGPPVWISEEALHAAMVSSNQPAGSRLRSVGHLFDYWQGLASDLEEYSRMREFEMAPDGTLIYCEPHLGSYYYGERAKDLTGLLELSTTVTSVQIVDSKPGFRFGQAGELLEAEVLSIIKDTGEEGAPRDGFFLFDRYARMVIDGKALCIGNRQIPPGKYTLFQIWANTSADTGLPIFFMDSSALISIDGAFYGALLESTVDSEQLARQLNEFLGLEGEKQ